MKKLSVSALAALIAVLGGCSMTVPVRGSIGKSEELFIGTTTGYMNGNGDLTITTESGISCNGQWSFTQRPTAGAGTFNCADGKVGTFNFTGDGQSGIGIGRTASGEPFRFRYGQDQERMQPSVALPHPTVTNCYGVGGSMISCYSH